MAKPKSNQGGGSLSKGKALSSRKKGLTTHHNSAEALQKQINLEDEYMVGEKNDLELPGVRARHRNRNTDKGAERVKRTAATRAVKRKIKADDELQRSSPVQVVERVSKELLVSLAQVKSSASVSIYFPVNVSLQNAEANQTAFKSVVQHAATMVHQQVPNASAVVQPALRLAADESMWKNVPPGLAVFLTHDASWVVKLPFSPQPLTVVNSAFHLAPLVPLLTDREYFFLLIVSKKKATLFSCDHFYIRRVEIDEMPEGIDDVVHFEEKDDQKLFRTGSSGAGGGANYHGIGAGKPDEKENISMYLKEVDRTLWSAILNNETAPLLIGGVEYLVNIFKGLTQYKNVWDEPLTGNLDDEDPKVLFETARKLIRPYFEEKTRKALDAYANHSASNLVSMRPVDIIPAAHYARVARLFVEEGATLWGQFDETKNSIVIHRQEQKNDEDLVNTTVLRTLLSGGEVHFLSPKDMPAHSPLAALMRY